MNVSRSHSHKSSSARPLVAFLLVASFGILFAGCKGPDDVTEPDYTFTEDDLALRDQLAGSGSTSSESSAAPYIEPIDGSGAVGGEDGPVLDLGLAKRYESVRTGVETSANGNMFRVINDFVNIRSTPDSGGQYLGRVEGGQLVDVIAFENAAWAKVKVADKEGFVSTRYIAKLVSEDQLENEKQKYAGKYFVNFGYVNIRKNADSGAEKLGQIPGQLIITPISVDGQWARVSFDGKEGYVSLQYLSPFLPNMLVRQDRYTLPILAYDLREQGALQTLGEHLTKLNQSGIKTMTLRAFGGILLSQEERDVRVPPKTAVLTIYGVTGQNQAELSSLLLNAGAKASLMIETKNLGLDGITEKMASTLLANGFDFESAGHTGDDLRSLTNAQLDLELRQSKQLLEDLTGVDVYAVGYPMGGVNSRVMESAIRNGYLLGVMDSPSKTFTREDLLRIPSYSISPSMSADEVLKLVQP